MSAPAFVLMRSCLVWMFTVGMIVITVASAMIARELINIGA
jgi:hypothetical protein